MAVTGILRKISIFLDENTMRTKIPVNFLYLDEHFVNPAFVLECG
jgi:hypothetical protein